MIYPLDVCTLLALGYREHVHHARSIRWVEGLQSDASHPPTFATCAMTELSFIRIAGGTSGLAENLTVARADLLRLKATLSTVFLGDAIEGNRLPTWVTKVEQTTDGHLLELAKEHQARLATLDTGIPGALLIPEEPRYVGAVREPAILYGEAA